MSENEGEFKKRILQIAHREEEPHSHGATGMQGWLEPLVIPISELNKIVEDAKKEIFSAWFKGTSLEEFQKILLKWLGEPK